MDQPTLSLGWAPDHPWAVELYVHGHHSGAYWFALEGEALADKEERRKFEVLGCRYIVTGPWLSAPEREK